MTSPVRARTVGSWPAAFRRSHRPAVTRLCQTIALATGLPGGLVPQHRRLALVGHADGGDVRRRWRRPAPWPRARSASWVRQMSSGSCSTWPGCGKIWRILLLRRRRRRGRRDRRRWRGWTSCPGRAPARSGSSDGPRAVEARDAEVVDCAPPTTAPIVGPASGTHHQPLPAAKTPLPQPATAVKRRGPRSRAGLIA